jgi:hypothetical protein
MKKGSHCSEESKQKNSEAHKGEKNPNYGKHLSEEIKKKLSEANKGKHYYNAETRYKMSEAHKGIGLGKHLSEETRQKISRTNKDQHRSEIAKKRMSEAHKGPKNYYWGKHLSEEHRRKISEAQRGIKGYYWKGGITSVVDRIRDSPNYNYWRQQCFIRDNFTCQKCRIKGGILHAHHKKSFSRLIEEIKQNLPLLDLYEGAMIYTPLWDIDNGITLCKKCHRKRRIKKWQECR